MDRRYPVGRFTFEGEASADRRAQWIAEIAALPARVRTAVDSLPAGAIDKPYREGGWTGRQVVHHLADSHMNSYVRFRLTLTEENPTIKPYQENLWAELADARDGDIEVSLALLEALHARWVALLRSLTQPQWTRTFVHPEAGNHDLNWLAALYAWHSRHHVAHLELLRNQ